MADRSLLDRLSRLVKIAPAENQSPNERSWSENSGKLLSTERKLYAIKVEDGEIIPSQFSSRKKKKKPELALKKWLAKCVPWKLPKAILLLSVLQLFFHVIGPMDLAYQTLAFSPVRKLELWRYFTYSLLHNGLPHLIINVILQLVISFPLETEVGHLGIMLVYIGGVLSGSLAASVTTDVSLMVGASSGIYSLLMSHVPHICMNFSSISYRFHRIVFVVVLSLSDIVYAIIHCLCNENKDPKIHITAHVAGAVSGILLGFIFYESSCESGNEENRDGDLTFRILKNSSIAICLCFVMFVVLTNVLAL